MGWLVFKMNELDVSTPLLNFFSQTPHGKNPIISMSSDFESLQTEANLFGPPFI